MDSFVVVVSPSPDGPTLWAALEGTTQLWLLIVRSHTESIFKN